MGEGLKILSVPGSDRDRRSLHGKLVSLLQM